MAKNEIRNGGVYLNQIVLQAQASPAEIDFLNFFKRRENKNEDPMYKSTM